MAYLRKLCGFFVTLGCPKDTLFDVCFKLPLLSGCEVLQVKCELLLVLVNCLSILNNIDDADLLFWLEPANELNKLASFLIVHGLITFVVLHISFNVLCSHQIAATLLRAHYWVYLAALLHISFMVLLHLLLLNRRCWVATLLKIVDRRFGWWSILSRLSLEFIHRLDLLNLLISRQMFYRRVLVCFSG